MVRVVREDPKDPALAYAGTVTSAYVSFDRGDRWQSLQLNLPTTVVSDLTIRDNDVVISTYGRGFWILDDVAPLRQARALTGSTAPVVFFKPSPASRVRWDNTQDTPLPPEMVVGENPPEGAILDYYLASAASNPITLTISDGSGMVVREYSSVAPAADPTMANVPDYWLAPLPVLSTSVGMYGDGVNGNREETLRHIGALRNNRTALVRRVQSAIEILSSRPEVNGSLAAIGYCFGGMVVLEYARSGAAISGVVSVHGSLETTSPARPSSICARILVCHGLGGVHARHHVQRQLGDAAVRNRFRMIERP